jgi:tetratricopeptide (TPR) repeat protein
MTPTNGVLMVARVDGPTPEIAKGLVDKAMEAEREGLWGRAYFDLRGLTNGPYKMGDDMIGDALKAARAYGYDITADHDENTFSASTPLPDAAFYFGWYNQSVSGPFTNQMVQFRPGAVAYHLHSFSSRELRMKNLWWTGPLLAAGATATMGCTEEPYLQTTPQVNVFLARFLFSGFSFGEAAYASQADLSWQNTIIGDPLYRPFGKTQKERYLQLEKAKDKNIEWSMLMWINLRLLQGAPMSEIEKFYSDNPETKTSAVMQERLGDVYKSKGDIFECIDAYRAALALPLNSLERLRLDLKAAPLLTSLGHADQAYEIYQSILKDYPNYLEKKDLYERLSDVASRLHKDDEAERYQHLAREGS